MKPITRGSVTIRINPVTSKYIPKGSTAPTFRTVYSVGWMEGGKRMRKAFADPKVAKVFAVETADRINVGDVDAIRLTSTEKAAYIRAMQLLRPYNLSLDAGAQMLADSLKVLDGLSLREAAVEYKKRHGGVKHKLLADAVTEYLTTKTDFTARYQYQASNILARLAKRFHVNVDSIGADDLQRYFIDHANRSLSTRNHWRRIISNLFSWCIAMRYCQDNPAAAVKLGDPPPSAVITYAPEDYARLLEQAAATVPDVVPILALCGFAGVRTAEALRLRWEHIDFAEGHIEMGSAITKTRSRRTIPLQDNLRAWLAPHAKESGPVWTRDHQYFYWLRKSISKRAGVKLLPNAARHTFCSCRLAISKSTAATSLECGHTEAVMLKHYRKLVSERQARAWFAIMPTQAPNVVQMPVAQTA